MRFPALSRETKSTILVGNVLPAVLLAALYGAISFDRRPVIDISTLEGKAVPQIVREAGELVTEWRVYRYRTCPTKIAREIVDSVNAVHRFDADSGPLSSTLGWDVWRSQVKIPPMAAWGTARYRSTISYQCGLTATWFPIVVKSPEIVFEIVPLTQEKIQELRG